MIIKDIPAKTLSNWCDKRQEELATYPWWKLLFMVRTVRKVRQMKEAAQACWFLAIDLTEEDISYLLPAGDFDEDIQS